MKRPGQPKVTAEQVIAWQRRPRKPIATKSRKRQLREAEENRPQVRASVFARDRYRCRLAGHGPCMGILTPHHRRKESQGGAYTVENLATVCSWHNERLEADADLAATARTMGLVVKRGDPGYHDLGKNR